MASRSGGPAGTQLTRPARGQAPPDRATLSSRRRFARRQWTRRWLAWRRVLAALVVVFLVAGTIHTVYFSDHLAVEKVTVTGVEELTDGQIRAAAEVPLGGPLATADLSAIELRVSSLARVRTAKVSRRWPNTVTVSVEEREPVAVVSINGKLQGLDREGVVFAAFRRAPEGLPRIETSIGTGSEALAEVASVVMALPTSLRSLVDFVRVDSIDTISLNLQDGRTVRWGSAERSSQKASVLEALLDQEATVYDVTVPEQPTISG